AAYGPMQGQDVGMAYAGTTDGKVGIHGHAHQSDRFKGAEEAAQWQPIGRHANPVIVVGRAQYTGDEDQADNDIKPFFEDFAVSAGKADEQVGQEGALDHFPYAFDPKVDGPPSVVNGHHVVGVVKQGRKIQQGGAGQAQ